MNLFLYLNRRNKFSFNALLGAAESLPFFDELRIELPSGIIRLQELVQEAARQGKGTTLVCFSFFTTQLWEIAALVRQIRSSAAGKVLLVAGGPHPSGDPRGTLHLGFDMVIRGEGEETFRDLLQSLHAGRDCREVAGLAYLDPDGAYHFTGPRPEICLDEYPPYSAKCNRFGPIEISRGCPFICHW